MGKLPHYWKIVIFVMGLISVVGTEVVQALANDADGTLDSADVAKLAVLVATGVGIYFKTNAPLPPAGRHVRDTDEL